MGFLEVGLPYDWPDSREDGIIEHIREHGIDQFLSLYNKVKGTDADELLWGDEIEFGIFELDQANGTVRCSLRSAEILKELQMREAQEKQSAGKNGPRPSSQPPQLLKSVSVFVQVPPQSVSPAWHDKAQLPDPSQTKPGSHAVPHVPQLAPSVSVLVQVPLQSVSPAWHESAHWPSPSQISPSAQAVPHAPQWSRELAVSVHTPSHLV